MGRDSVEPCEISNRGPLTEAHLAVGLRRVALVRDARALRAQRVGWPVIAERLGVPVATLFRYCAVVRDIPEPTAADLTPRWNHSGRPRKYAVSERDARALRKQYLLSNRTATAGSSEEAARMALRKGELSPAAADMVRTRATAGQPLLTDALRREVIVPEAAVKQFRNPTDAGLDYFSSPGTMMWVQDRLSGDERWARAGDILEADDGTINLVCCVPWDSGCPCSDKYKVKVGRFQFIPAIDVGTRMIVGYSYTARPMSSYRAEDITSLLHVVFSQHGVWERARFERGVFESKLVKRTLELNQVELLTVWSPHQKPFIEGLFNVLWTKLSDLPGQVGRQRGEMEAENLLLESCRTGARDPRRHFPMLADVLQAFDQVIAEKNLTRVKSRNYGTWIPAERWEQQRGEGRLRPLDPSSEWMFSPCVREWTVRGHLVGGAVPIMDGFSVQYDFSAPWLPDFHGRTVRAHFDPAHPDCYATVVLAERHLDHQVGEVLGVAHQVNRVARYARRVLRWGDDPDLGLDAQKKARGALRREVRAIVPDGKPAVKVTEMRDGLGNSATISVGRGVPAEPSGGSFGSRLKPPTPAQQTRRRNNLASQAELANRLRELQET
ncbi:MAG: hypothetical protein ACYDH9_08095 [Limisphaerales bacterium]